MPEGKTELVEELGGLAVGVIVEQSVDLCERVGGGLAGLPGVQGLGDGQDGGLAAAEPDVQMDLVGFGERDVFDQQPRDPFALPCWRRRVVPEPGEVGGELADLLLVLLGERGVGGSGLAFVLVLGGLQRAQRVVPVGLERVGNESVVRVDGEIAAAGELGALAGPVDVAPPQPVGFSARVVSSAWTLSATSSASGVTVSTNSWLIAASRSAPWIT